MAFKWLTYTLMLGVQFFMDILIKVKDITQFLPKSKKKRKRFIIICGRFYHIPFRIYAILIFWKFYYLFSKRHKSFSSTLAPFRSIFYIDDHPNAQCLFTINLKNINKEPQVFSEITTGEKMLLILHIKDFGLRICRNIFQNEPNWLPVFSYVIVLSGDSDIIPGETAQFRAEVLKDDSRTATDEFRFKWSDNFIPKHSDEFISVSPALWNVTYNSTSVESSNVTVTVTVYKHSLLIWTLVGSATKTFDITAFLKGDLAISQGNQTRNKYVSNAESVSHEIVIEKSHLDFLNKTKNFLRTFWFVDCIYYGQKNDFKFSFNYTKVESVHHVEALLVATYIPALNNNQTLPFYLMGKPLLDSISKGNASSSEVVNQNSVDGTLNNEYLDKTFKEWLLQYNQTHEFADYKSDYCLNSSVIPVASNYTYGFFRTKFTVKAPVKISPINGTNWLMDGEVLNINVSCNGSSPYSFCVLLKSGLYNVTGNETCKDESKLLNCSFGIQHLFKKPSEYTLVVIISNSVSHVIKPIAINIYKVKKHAQLSVIIVPVSFSLIATILIIFGVAYYVQSKRKYTIEVADFDFGNQTGDMEHKSFTERLRESISNSLMKSHSYEESKDSWPESSSNSRKYGSMED